MFCEMSDQFDRGLRFNSPETLVINKIWSSRLMIIFSTDKVIYMQLISKHEISTGFDSSIKPVALSHFNIICLRTDKAMYI